MKRTWKEMLLRITILLFGLTIAHLGVTLFLLADLGADPFNVLIQGIFRTISRVMALPLLTHGYTHVAVNLLIILILLLVDKSYIKVGTVLCMICGGPIIDLFTRILCFIFEEERPFWFKLITLALGCVILACGMTMVIKSDAGTGPNDLVAVVISDKFHAKFGIVRIIVDVTFVLVGFLLSGAVGIGTIVCAFMVGPVAGYFMPLSERIVNIVLSKFDCC